jgi:hypothetical protein
VIMYATPVKITGVAYFIWLRFLPGATKFCISTVLGGKCIN